MHSLSTELLRRTISWMQQCMIADCRGHDVHNDGDNVAWNFEFDLPATDLSENLD